VEFVVEMEENVFPMVGPGAGNSTVVMDPALTHVEPEAVGPFETTHIVVPR
jgi:hypothetical protein